MKIRNVKYPIKPGTEDIRILPLNLSISEVNLTDLINFIYSNLIYNINYIISRVILILKNIDVKKISNMIIDQLLSKAYIYTSADLVDLIEGHSQLYSSKFLRSSGCNPLHNLQWRCPQ